MLPILVACLMAPSGGADLDLPGDPGDLGVPLPAFLRPLELHPANLPELVSDAAITDIEAFYFDNDQLPDLAVAWYADDPTNPMEPMRYLTIYRGLGGSFDRLVDIDLYRPSTFPPPLDDTVFENGTGEIVPGDYDGDGDQDLAVLPYFGAEIWFIENQGGGAYTPHFEYIFGQFGGGFLTPPEGAAADFDEDGRDDLVYVVNPTPNASGQLHFWRTPNSMSNMGRVPWEGIDGGVPVTDTLGLAVGDFDGDMRPDVAFSAREQIVEDPRIVIWHSFDAKTQEFAVQLLAPTKFAADLVAVTRRACGDDLIIDDRSRGKFIEVWMNDCTGDASMSQLGRVAGLTGGSDELGQVLVTGDLNADGSEDIAVRQRIGLAEESEQVQLLLWDPVEEGYFVDSEAINTEGYENLTGNQLLRPRNVAVMDLMGSPANEVVVGFGSDVQNGTAELRVLIWPNGCYADVNQDGEVGIADLVMVLDTESMAGDVNRDMVVDFEDLALLLANYGCRSDG